MGIRDAFGEAPQQPNELIRQLGYVASYGQPDFRPGRGSDGPFDGLGSAIADLVGGPSAEESATRDLLGMLSDRSQRMAKTPAMPGANAPRPKDVAKSAVQSLGNAYQRFGNNPVGMFAEGFDAKSIAAALKAIQGAPYELGVRQGDPRAREVFDEQARVGTRDLLDDGDPTDEMLDAAVRNPRAAALLDEAYGSGKQAIAEDRMAQTQRQANIATNAWAAITDPYASAAGATVALQDDDLGRELVNQPEMQRMMHNPNVRGASIDLLEQVKTFGPEKLDELIDGETRVVPFYADGDPEKPESSADYGKFADLILHPGGAKIRGQSWTLSVRDGSGESSKAALHEDVGNMIKAYLGVEPGADADPEEFKDVQAQLRPALDQLATGISTKEKVDPKIRALASEIAGTVFQKYGRNLYLTNLKEGASNTDHIFLGPDGDFSKLLGSRTIRTGEFQGRPTVAEQYGLSDGQREALKRRYLSATEKLVGPMEGFLKQKWTARLTEMKVDPKAIDNLVESALQETRPKLLTPGVKKAFQRDPEGFYQKRVSGNFERWLADEQGIVDKSGMTPAAAGFVRVGEAIESSDALQSKLADPLGSMGGSQDDELMMMLEQGRQQPRYGAHQAPPDVAPPGPMQRTLR